MNAIIKQLRIMRAAAGVTYKEWAAYRTHSMVSIFVGPVYYLVQISIWRAVYASQEQLRGMTLPDMLAYYGAAALIGYLTMDFADWNLQMLINTGKYINFSLRPVHHRFFALSQKIGHRTLGLLYEFIPVFIIFTAVFGVNVIPAAPLWAAVSVTLSFFMNFYINYSIGLAGFWLTKTGGLRNVLGVLVNIMSGMVIPLTFFPEAFQKVMFFLPFQYITYVPSMVFTGRYMLGGVPLSVPQIVGVQFVYVLAVAALSEVLYRKGQKRYMGVGI